MNQFEIIDTKVRITADNDKEAENVRELLKENKVFLVNLMASPGAGKTTTLERTIRALKEDYRIGVMEADVDHDIDAKRIAATGAKVIQLHTGGSCHMDADMTLRGLERLDISDLDLVFLENVGNLVCPAEFDVGANIKAMILSVPEGDDKPLKYPLMFQVSDVLLVNKTDVREVFDFDTDRLQSYVRNLNEKMPVIEISAKNGDGFEAWIEWLKNKIEEWRNVSITHD